MARKKREYFTDWKDAAQKHRGAIAYTIAILTLVGGMVGWGLLPDPVSLYPAAAEPLFHPKWQILSLNLGVSLVFSGLFWRKPRELAYLFCAGVGLVMTFALLYTNLGV